MRSRSILGISVLLTVFALLSARSRAEESATPAPAPAPAPASALSPAPATGASEAPAGTVVIYPTPDGEVLSTEYEVTVQGQKVDVYSARTLDPPFAGKEWDYGGNYSFASFDMSGTVTVRIASRRSLARTRILPASAGVVPQVESEHAISFRLDRPRKLSIEPEGKKGPLLLFANPIETDPPKPGEPGVVHFAPGVHSPGKIVLESNQTLYLAGGAVVKAEVLAKGERIRILGRGILDGSEWEWRKGPIGNLIAIRDSTQVEVSGITLRGSSHWTIVPTGSNDVTIRNVKLCNSRVQNDDGINPCNSRNVRIADCFIRSDDDCVAMKGLDPGEGAASVEDVTVEDSILWCDRARIFLLGHESRAPFLRRIRLRNLDIIHFTMTAFLFEPGEDMRLEDVEVDGVRIEGEGQREFIRLKPVVNQYMRKQVPGFIRGVRFRDVSVTGAPGEYKVEIEGADPEHTVRDASFERVTVLGEELREGSPRLRVGKHVDGVRFARGGGASASVPSDASLLEIGTASSMEKVIPRGVPREIHPVSQVALSLARGEKEGLQILVRSPARDLEDVVLSSGDLVGEGGSVLPASAVQCHVVGYVETKARPPYGADHVGWWPDPILDFLGPIRVAAGDIQAFWVRVAAPRDQAPGLYKGTLRLAARGLDARSVDLEVRVRSFALPLHPPLPLAVTFGLPLEEEYSKMLRGFSSKPEWEASLKYAWADFLADYCIGYDHLYRAGPPDFDVLRHLQVSGRLGTFNLGNFSIHDRDGEAPRAAEVEVMLAWAKEAHARAKALGILDHAYIYGFDEASSEWFPVIEGTAARVKKELPGCLVLTTAYDKSYGLDTVMRSIDAWTPLTAAYDPDRAAAARAQGRKVWWYICCGPHHPHANMFIEYPAIEARLLMGPMTVKYRPDGFLYYQTSIWRSETPIETGPFTTWNPVSWTTYHGDGSWTCMGPGGKPVPTIRLENFRDGLEDYAYARILEEAVSLAGARGEAASATERAWLAEAKAALEVPPALVQSLTEYSRDPAVLAAWRERLGEVIDRAGRGDLDPWKGGLRLVE